LTILNKSCWFLKDRLLEAASSQRRSDKFWAHAISVVW